MLIGIGPALRKMADGQTFIVDADNGTLSRAPTARSAGAGRDRTVDGAARAKRRAARGGGQGMPVARRHAGRGVRESRAASPTRIAAVENGAEGCGLLRTEFLFIDRETPPTEDEQVPGISKHRQHAGGRPLILANDGCRRRQTAALFAAAARGESGAGVARRAHRAAASGTDAHAIAGGAARGAVRHSCVC